MKDFWFRFMEKLRKLGLFKTPYKSGVMDGTFVIADLISIDPEAYDAFKGIAQRIYDKRKDLPFYKRLALRTFIDAFERRN